MSSARPAGEPADDRLRLRLAEEFPTLPPAATKDLLGPLRTADGAVPEGVAEGLAAALMRDPDRPFAELLPGLEGADGAIPPRAITGMTAAALEELGVRDWTGLGPVRPSALLAMPGVGESKVSRVMEEAVREALRLFSLRIGGTRSGTGTGEEDTGDGGRRLAAAFDRLADWSGAERPGAALGDLLELRFAGEVPDDVRGPLRSLAGTPAESLRTRPTREPPGAAVERLCDDLLGELRERDRAVFLERVRFADRPTLEELAAREGVTRERIRQLEERSGGRLRAAAGAAVFRRVRWRAASLAAHLGAGVPADGERFREAERRTANGFTIAGREILLRLLLWLAGPYRVHPDGWLLREGADLPGPEFADAATGDDGAVDLDRLGADWGRGGVPAGGPAGVGRGGRPDRPERGGDAGAAGRQPHRPGRAGAPPTGPAGRHRGTGQRPGRR